MDPYSTLPPEESFPARIYGNLIHPVDHFRRYREEPFRSSFWYYVKILAIVLICQLGIMIPLALMPEFREGFLDGAGLAGYSLQAYFTKLILGAVVAFFCLLIVVVLDASITQAAIYIVGGTKGFAKTVQAIMLSYVPALLLQVFSVTLILFVGFFLLAIGAEFIILILMLLFLALYIISLIWSAAVRVVALQEFHDFSTMRAIFTAVFSVIVILILAAIIVIAAAVSGPAFLPDAPASVISAKYTPASVVAGKDAPINVVAGREAPAKDWLPLAEDAMKAKNSNAVLITVNGHSDAVGVRLPPDGRCHVWTYEYASKAEDKLYIVTVRDGSVDNVQTVALSSRGVETILYKYGDPTIQSWTVDSDQAAAAAGEKYRELMGDQTPASAAYKLSLSSWHQLTWTVYNYDETTRVTANIDVDPESGTIVHTWAPGRGV